MCCGKNHAGGYCVWISMNTEHSATSAKNKCYPVICHRAPSYSHLQAIQATLWLGRRDGGAAGEPQGPGALVVSRDIPGTGVFVVSAGSWDTVAQMAATVTDGRMGSEDRGDSAPPTTTLYSAHRLLPSVWQKSAHQRESRCTHGPPGRSPWSDLWCKRHAEVNNGPQKKTLCIFSKVLPFSLRPTGCLLLITPLCYRTS